MVGRSGRWARVWPVLLAVVTLLAVGGPAAVASYRHARTVVERSGDLVMAPFLPLTADGLLVAALVVIWVRRYREQPPGRGPWAAFWLGILATVAANLAAAERTAEGILVALWIPVCVAVTLELVALVIRPAAQPAEDPAADAASEPVDEPRDELSEEPGDERAAPGDANPARLPDRRGQVGLRDDDIISDLRALAAARGRTWSRDDVKEAYGIGSTRAGRLLVMLGWAPGRAERAEAGAQ